MYSLIDSVNFKSSQVPAFVFGVLAQDFEVSVEEGYRQRYGHNKYTCTERDKKFVDCSQRNNKHNMSQ